MNPFIHKPTRKNFANSTFIHPTATPKLWHCMWDMVRQQDWYQNLSEGERAKIGYINNDGKYCYFQMRGVTTGLAAIKFF